MKKSLSAQRGQARTQRPERTQIEMQHFSLDQLIDADHRVRYVWQYVQSLDLSSLYDQIKAAGSNAGRTPIDPQILFALWLFATIEGVSSARQLDRLAQRDFAYMWICGRVSVNYHTLADFRALNGELLEHLMVDSIAVLLQQDLITLQTVAQDGMRVRAKASSDSFRRRPTLEETFQQAQAHLDELKQQQEESPADGDARRRAARQRAAEEKVARVGEALAQLEELNRIKQARKEDTESTRVSMTDPDARRMKMSDGGFRPALNVQFATDGLTRLIVGASVTNSGNDAGQMGPMHENILNDYGVPPGEYLVDGPFVTHGDVEQLAEAGTEVLGPVPGQKRAERQGQDPYARKRDDSDTMAEFRQRMSTESAKTRYQARPSIAEFPNADCRNRGLSQFRVQGLFKAKSQAMWHVHAYNLLRLLNLGWLPALIGGKP
jgi:transposase